MTRIDAGWHPALTGVSLILLDFDGPVVRLLPDPQHLQLAEDMVRWCADRTGQLPDVLAVDHVAVLRYIHQQHPELAARAESMATASELTAAGTREAYPDAIETMRRWLADGGRLAVVSNNAEKAVRLVLDRAELSEGAGLSEGGAGLSEGAGLPKGTSADYTVHARQPDAISQLKPSPDLLLQAMQAHGVPASRTVMVGDTVGDVRAGQAAGVPTIGVAATPDRARRLEGAGAVAVVARLPDLRTRGAITGSPSGYTQ